MGVRAQKRTVNLQSGCAYERSCIERVHEDLSVVPQNAQVDHHGGESENDDQDQLEEDEYLPTLSFAAWS
jgi:hypothetical protein